MDNSKLFKPDLARYSNADHIEFHKQAYPICNQYAAVIADKDLLDAYSDKIKQEETVFKWIRRSEYTAKKAEADHARDEAFTGLTIIVRANLRNANPTLRDNALHINNLIETYRNLTNVDYDAETAGIDSLVARLWSADYNSAATALGIFSWITDLETKNNLFKTFVDDTEQEQIDKPDINPKDARRQTDEALRHITARVTAFMNLNGPADYALFAEAFNVLVSHYNTLVHEHYGRLHARTDITPAEIAGIPVQTYTGSPVYVIPLLTLRITEKDGTIRIVELVFSQDYTVAYRNNVDPGTATLIIRGIGRYVGEITTTFNIERPND
jgi:hypothetical protein